MINKRRLMYNHCDTRGVYRAHANEVYLHNNAAA